MHLSRAQIHELDSRKRANIINSITGIKPANLIGTRSDQGISNLAIFSSLVHLGSNPALLGFILRPVGEVPRHTYENIKKSSYYTINQVPTDVIEKAHYTSAKLDQKVSEFSACHLTEETIDEFPAPFVKESQLKIGMKFEKEMPIPLNNTILVIGSVEQVSIDQNAVADNGYIDLESIQTAGISGLNTYYSVSKLESYPYARPTELPDFGT